MSVRGFNTGSGIEQYDYDYLANKPAAPTKENIGLGNVDNTSDMDKPVSTSQEQALSQKVDKVPGMGLSSEDYTSAEKEKLGDLPTNTELEAALDGKASAESVAALESAVNDPDNGLETKASAIINTASGAIASFSDGADSMPVKKLVVAVEPAQDLHGYDHPWPAGGGINKYSGAATIAKDAASIYYRVEIEPIECPATITFSAQITNEYGAVRVAFRDTNGGAIAAISVNASDNRTSATVTISETATISVLYLYGSTATNVQAAATFKDIQIELGETAHAYAPYSNICPISGWTGAEIGGTGVNVFDIDSVDSSVRVTGTDTVSLRGWVRNLMTGNNIQTITPVEAATFPTLPAGSYVLSFKVLSGATGKNIRLYGVSLEDGSTTAYTEGIPSTGSDGTKYFTFTCTETIHYCLFGVSVDGEATIGNIQIEEGTSLTSYRPYTGSQISVTFPSSAGTVYGATLTVYPDRTGTLVVDRADVDMGTLDWSYNGERFQASRSMITTKPTRLKGISDIYPVYNGTVSSAPDKSLIFSDTSTLLYVKDSAFTDAAEFKAGMSGHSIVYLLATPVTYTLTSDQISGILETLYGTNNIWADCGDVDVTYVSDTKLFIEQLTQPTEDDMTADHAISAGTFFMIGNTLYLATSQIAAGATITPGTNATQLSLADALNQLNA